MPFDVVDAPPAAAPPYGLIATLRPRSSPISPPPRWTNGIRYDPEGCIEGETQDRCNPGAIDDLTHPDIVEWYPYFLTANYDCTANPEEVEEAPGKATRLLNMDTERQLGRELWTGTLAQSGATIPDGSDYPNTWLADVANVDILTESGEVNLVHGLACLEEYLKNNNGGQRGMIHATAQIATHWISLNVAFPSDDYTRLFTGLGTPIVVSPGYDGTSPDGTVGDDNIWAYATDTIRVFLADMDTTTLDRTTAGIVDRDENNVRTVAFRPALAEWQRCRHAGVRLAAQACDEGGS